MNGPTAAATTPRAKGPVVWLDMDQRELDDAYDQLVYAPNRDQLGKRRIANSAAARADRRPAPLCLWADANGRPRCLSCVAEWRREGKRRSSAGRDFRSRRRLAQRRRIRIYVPC